MRIALVAHSNAPWTAPYARFFRREGHEVRVISFHPDPIDGIPVEFVGREPFDANEGKLLFVTRAPRVRKILRDFAPDVVLACYIISNGLTAALAWDGPLVVSGRGGGILRQTRSGEPGPPTALRSRILRYVLRNATGLHAVSDEVAEEMVRLGADADALEVFPLGVELSHFPLAAQPLSEADVPHIICTRKHEPIYRNIDLVHALADLRDRGFNFRCTFAGQGELLDSCRNAVRERRLDHRVSFVGNLPHNEIPALLASAHLYVSASISDGTSSSLLEAMATGLYPIVTDIRANQSWIENGKNGGLFEVGRVDQLAAAIARVLDDPASHLTAMDSNRRRVERDGSQDDFNRKLLGLLRRAATKVVVEPAKPPLSLRGKLMLALAGAGAAGIGLPFLMNF